MDEELFKTQLHALQQQLANMARQRFACVPPSLDPFAAQLEKVEAPLLVMTTKSNPVATSIPSPQARSYAFEKPHETSEHLETVDSPLDVITRQITRLQASVSELEDRFDALDLNRFTPPASTSDVECTSLCQELTATSNVGTASAEQPPSLVAPNGQPPLWDELYETTSSNNTSEMPAEIPAPPFPSPDGPTDGIVFRDSEIVRLDEQLKTAQARLQSAETQITDQARWIAFLKQDQALSLENYKRLSCNINELQEMLRSYRTHHLRHEMETTGLKSNLAVVPNPSQAVHDGQTAQPDHSASRQPREDFALEELKKEITRVKAEMQYWEDLCEEKDRVIGDQDRTIIHNAALLDNKDAKIQALHCDIAKLQGVKSLKPRCAWRTAGKQRDESTLRRTLSDSTATTVRAFSPPSGPSYHTPQYATTARQDYTTGAPFFPGYWHGSSDRVPSYPAPPSFDHTQQYAGTARNDYAMGAPLFPPYWSYLAYPSFDHAQQYAGPARKDYPAEAPLFPRYRHESSDRGPSYPVYPSSESDGEIGSQASPLLSSASTADSSDWSRSRPNPLPHHLSSNTFDDRSVVQEAHATHERRRRERARSPLPRRNHVARHVPSKSSRRVASPLPTGGLAARRPRPGYASPRPVRTRKLQAYAESDDGGRGV